MMVDLLFKIFKKEVVLVKEYYVQYNIGRSKYALSFHDGVKKHDDGSPIYDIRLFRNKQRLKEAIKNLESEGYKEIH